MIEKHECPSDAIVLPDGFYIQPVNHDLIFSLSMRIDLNPMPEAIRAASDTTGNPGNADGKAAAAKTNLRCGDRATKVRPRHLR